MRYEQSRVIGQNTYSRKSQTIFASNVNQLWNNINRHILIPWQSITVVLGTFAIFSLVEKQIISLDLASALIVLIAAWQIAHVYDASTWVNRNLAIIVNIEKQFLITDDVKNIHWFFQSQRKWDHLGTFWGRCCYLILYLDGVSSICIGTISQSVLLNLFNDPDLYNSSFLVNFHGVYTLQFSQSFQPVDKPVSARRVQD